MNKKIIHTVFENQVDKTPQNIAIVEESRDITYENLNKEANSIANSIEPNQFVAIFLPNSIDYVKSLLGILKAGAIFVPIDILAPTKRVDDIIKKADIKTIITNLEYLDELKSIIKNIEILVIEEIEPNYTNPTLQSTEESEAYLIFTSGSTGEPKAIIGVQKSLSHFIHWEKTEFNIDEEFKISQLSGVTFDVSLRDIFTALISGATLYIPKDRRDIEYLAKWISDSRLTLIHIVPSLFRLLVREFEFHRYDLSNLKHILLAGEALYGSDVRGFYRLYPHIELVNLYGPSETTLAKIFNRIKIEDIKEDNMIIPLGKPISNTQILILKNDKLASVKQSGEIYIKTPFRSKGYLKEPQHTKEVFIQNPLNPKEDIIYKTGDLGRYQSDGTIEFIGRVDNQVKINGIRVELNEIEVAIKSYENIENAVVISQLSDTKELVVICYYIEKNPFDEDDIVDYLFEIIPEYMIPNFLIKMEEFPLNYHGKIDKKAFPKPQELIYIGKDFIAPKTPIEKDIANIFSEVLQIEKISIDIAFTKLGGNSLNAISAVAKINHTLGIKINIKEFFENQSVEKLALLIVERLDEEEIITTLDIAPLPKASSYELSNAQHRLWVLDKMQDNLNAYNIVGAVEFNADVNIEILEKAIYLLVNRHEILRTNFITIENQPRQIVDDNIKKSIFQAIEVEDIEEYMRQEAKRVFDLSKESLFYIKLINKTTLFVNMHHIISDGWSIAIIIKELSQIYTSFFYDREVSLTPLNIQYRDFAYWQNRLLEDDNFIQTHQNYWHNLLKTPTTLNFPLDYPRGVHQTFNGNSFVFGFDKEITQKIKSLSQDSTLFITLLTITNILLSKYSNQDDIIVGSPIANREDEALLNQIGFYVNTLALRTKLNQNISFEANLKSITDVCLEAFSHQSYPFDKLVNELGLERDLSQNPLFNTMVILQNNENAQIEFANLKSKGRDISQDVSKFDISFSYFEIDGHLELSIEYNSDLLKADTIERFCLNLERLIDSIELDKNLNELEFISHNEQNILDTLNQTYKEYPKDKSIIEIFEKVVKKSSDNIAIVSEDNQLSYKELNQRANSVGYYLRENFKIKSDTIIPIIANRTAQMIVGVLGILKSKGAYLPIDSSYPKDRIEYILQDSKAKLILTDRANFDSVQEYAKDLDMRVVCIDDISLDNTKNLKIYNSPNDLAYVIYTSGTTGEPKGVMVEHSGFVNMMLYQIESFDITPDDNIAQFASFSFDASVYETFLALLSGASYVLIKKDKLLNEFRDICKRYNINTAVLNPTFLANIGELEKFKTIITAGEKAIVQDALKYAKKCNYINAYGPTEVSVCSAFHKVNPTREYKSIPIGNSIANIKNYILNDNLQELPIGAIGEIYTAGVGLARGYLGRDELTQEKFINHPTFGRIYKTGDVARYNQNREIEYLGRVDNQVKIRGNRVELGEIDNTILTSKEITEALCIIKDEELVAYVVGDDRDLKSHLKERLPDFMIPKYIISLRSFPLTPNGKIDTKALPNPTIKIENKIKPQSELEILLCDIYQDVLGVEVGVEDSFFDFGGDSIKAIQISSRVGSLGYKLDIKHLFSYPSIKEIIPFMDKKHRDINQDEIIGEIPYTPIQKWFWDLNTEDKHYFNQDLLLEIDANIDKKRVKKIVKKLISHHDILRASYKNELQFNNSISDSDLSVKEYEITDIKELKKITKKISKGFDLSKTPLIKFALISDKNSKYLYIVAHHLVIDGVSWRILLEDLTTLYNKQPLPLKTDSFQTYSNRLRSYAKEIEGQMAYWEKFNIDFKLQCDNTLDTKRVSKDIKNLSFTLDKDITKNLLEDVNFAYNTSIQDILLLGLNISLFKSFGVSKSIIGMESHGREDILGLDLSRSVGWFTALYPVMLDYNESDLSTQIKLQKESMREIPNSGIGYGVLKYLSKKDLDFSKEILFNYLGQFDDEREGVFNIVNEKTASSVGDNFVSEFKLDISAIIVNREFFFGVKYHKDEYNKESIESFLDIYKNTLMDIISHCMSKESSELTPDDIDDKDFDIASLNDFLSDLEIED